MIRSVKKNTRIRVEKAEVQLRKAAAEYVKLRDQIAPFVRLKKVTEYSSEGQWGETSAMLAGR